MKTKECPSCAMEVAASSSECPICNYEFPKQNRFFQVVAIILVLAILWFIVF